MEHKDLALCAQNLMDQLPAGIHEQLVDVEVAVCQDPDMASAMIAEISDDPKPAASDCKGLFFGFPAEIPEGVSDDEDDGADEVTLPEGVIFLCASNIEDGDIAEKVLLHEVGHALGLSEQEIMEWGLDASDEPEKEKVTDAKTSEPERAAVSASADPDKENTAAGVGAADA